MSKPNVVNFSGGRTSAYLVWLFEQKRRIENCEVEYVFCDTGAEHPKTYEFIRRLVKEFNINLTCLRAVVSPKKGVGPTYKVITLDECRQDLQPFKDYVAAYGAPNPMFHKCSNTMKGTPCDKYCNDKYGRGGYIKWLGIRIDEPKRMKVVDDQLDLLGGAKKVAREYLPMRYLGQISDMEKQDILDFWADQPFDLEIPEVLGNCVFCIKKGVNKIALASKYEPQMAKDFNDLLGSDDVRDMKSKKDAGLKNTHVFRGRLSLKDVDEIYKDHSIEDLERTIRFGKKEAAGSCSESCDPLTMDLFEG